MVAPLSNWTVVEQQAVICFMWSEAIKTSEIYKRVLVKYCMGQKMYMNG
jgi:hypothetical protein